MSTSYELSPRLKRLECRLKSKDYKQPKPWYFENVNILNIPENEYLKKESIVIRKAYAIRYVAEHIPTPIYEDELIVGVPNQSSVEFGMCMPRYLTEDERDYFRRLGLSELSLSGHHPPDWSRIIEKGISGLREEVSKQLLAMTKVRDTNNEAEVENETDELRAMLLSLDGLETLAIRYADKALELAVKEKGKTRKQELLKIYETLCHVPDRPADTLQEAVQSFWITYTLLASCGEFLPLGRIDQYLIKYYLDDIHLRRIDDEQARDIIGSFLIKCNERNVLDAKKFIPHMEYGTFSGVIHYVSREDTLIYENKNREHFYHDDEPEDSVHNKYFGQEANNRMMTCVVGGTDSNGNDAANRLSGMIIELISEMRLLFPTVGVRMSKNTKDELLNIVADAIRSGQGEPVIYNDESILKSFSKLSITADEARNYSSDGCWETIIPGVTNFSYSLVNTLQCLEYVFNHGHLLKTGAMNGLDCGDIRNLTTYDMFYTVFLKELYYVMDALWRINIENRGISSLSAPDPLLSVLCDDCIESGRDFYGDGAKYHLRCLLLTGFADTVDSLNVIKKLVYEDRKITIEELHGAMLDNWKGHERLLAYIRNRIPKYGDNDVTTDSTGIRLIKDFSSKIIELRKRSYSIQLTGGIGTFHMYALWGDTVHASANGRQAYDALAPNYSPVPGNSEKGPLAAIMSATRADLSEMTTGTPLDLSVNSNEFEEESGRERLKDLIRGFIDMDGQILTITATSAEELKEAMLYPEKHKDLRVRMGGLSAYFIQLAPAQQEKIIERFVP